MGVQLRHEGECDSGRSRLAGRALWGHLGFGLLQDRSPGPPIGRSASGDGAGAESFRGPLQGFRVQNWPAGLDLALSTRAPGLPGREYVRLDGENAGSSTLRYLDPRRITHMVQREGLVDKLHVSADGTGQVGHAGSALLAGVADRVGLTRALSEAMVSTRQRRSAHDPGVVLRDLAVTLADGGDCLADLGAQRDQADLFGDVASDATAFRVIDSVDERCLERLRAAVALARARAWKLWCAPTAAGGALSRPSGR